MVNLEINRQLRLLSAQSQRLTEFQRELYTQLNERRTISILFKIDGFITTGSKGYIEIPFNCIITGWVIMADRVGNIVVDIRRCRPDEFPTTTSICGTEKPTLSSQQRAENMHLTTWDTNISTGDILEFVVDSVSGGLLCVTISLRAIRE